MNGRVEVYFDSILWETDHASWVLFDEEANKKEWLPKSQFEITEPNVMEMSEWLAYEKGLI